MRRRQPGPYREIGNDVLFAGKSRYELPDDRRRKVAMWSLSPWTDAGVTLSDHHGVVVVLQQAP